MTSNATSAAVREQLIRALELDLVGPTPGLLAQLEAEGQSQEAAEFRGLWDRSISSTLWTF